MPTPEKYDQKENASRLKQQRQDLLTSIRRTFDNPDGVCTLAWLHSTSASGVPAFLPGKDGSFCPIAAAFRNGRQSIIMELTAALAEAGASRSD